MANAKLPQSRSRQPRSITGPKGGSKENVNVRRESERIPPELLAPITGEIEHQLKQLVAKFGEKKVREAQDPLMTKCKWKDWQGVANAIQRIARQKSAT